MIKIIDLFAGIGGFHLAFHNLGATCVFMSEKDKFARQTYEHNFKSISPQLFSNSKLINTDILKLDLKDIPSFDILCAGFPCQPFSVAGYQKGFMDTKEDRGNMFFKLAEIIDYHKPQAFFLENVRNLKSHDKGKTFDIIRNVLEKDLDYSVHFEIIKAYDYGLPQMRPRIFMIGFRDKKIQFKFPKKISLCYNMSEIMKGNCEKEIGYTVRVGGRRSGIDDRHNWDAYRVDGEVRILTIDETKKLCGYPDWFTFPVSDTQAFKQLGNTVAVLPVELVSKEIIKSIK